MGRIFNRGETLRLVDLNGTDDRSDEPRLTASEAIDLLTVTDSLAETSTVLHLVRAGDRRKVIGRAGRRRQRIADALERARWADQVLPFGPEAA